MTEILDFINSNALLVGATVIVFLLAVFNELKIKEGDVCGLTPIEAVKLINQNAVIYDLRSPTTYKQKHILGATNIEPESLLANNHDNKNPLLLVCESGGVSKKTSLSLRKKNLDNTFYIKGGQTAWETGSLPVSSNNR
jgi:rhodanese-related sulfurtransferase|tara:strand:- start:653 stop:1069 length:417 start_codon:yes stop_codon:yes gene_type:complete